MGGGAFLHHVLLDKNIFFLNFQLKLNFVMTKAVSNREICFIKAVLSLRDNGHFFSSKIFENGVLSPPPPILLGLSH